MLTEERQKQIVAMVETSGTVSVPDLAQHFETSESTIRRDLDRLDQDGLLVKVRGGASSVASALRGQARAFASHDMSLTDKFSMNSQEKARIGAYAATLVGPDDFVFIDAGSTTLALVKNLAGSPATFVTNSLGHARVLASQGCKVIVTGGELKPNTEALVGSDALGSISRYNFTLGFWGTNGVTPEQGFTTPETNEASFKSLSMKRCQARYVLADATKIGMVAPITFADFSTATLITCGEVASSLVAYNNVLEVQQ